MMDDMPEMGFPHLEPFGSALAEQSVGGGEFLNEHIARIEALKIRIFGHPELPEWEKQVIFRELDLLRGAFIEMANLHSLAGQWLPKEAKQPRHVLDPSQLILEGILGQSERIDQLLRIIAKISATDLTVLLEGETGTGKELLARIIHLNSNRTKFVAVNCGAFPSGIIESELFGHIKGAFTGATTDRKGKFEEADQGTIFLDEIGDLELSAQVKLLRVLEQGELQRVGSDRTYRIDVRIIAATNKYLEKMVQVGTFREDLFFRLNVCPLTIPPLRERRDEIELLLEFFLQEMSGGKSHLPRLDRELRRFIVEEYPYPGNIRELKNMAKYISCIAGPDPVSIADLPERYRRSHLAPPEPEPETKDMTHIRQNAERDYLVKILEKNHGNIAKVCAETALSRSRVYQLLKQFDLKPTNFRP